MKYPSLREEKKLWRRRLKKVVCLDEAGRGPLSGPVVAAAVMIKISNFQFLISNQFPISELLQAEAKGKKRHISSPSNFQFPNIKDSKKLTPKKREELYKILTKHPAIKWGIGRVSEKVIDKINIKNAAELAMEKALKKLRCKPDFLIIDGNHIKNRKLKSINYKLIVKGDEKVFSCSAASIIAKVSRDRIMLRYHKKFPQYGFDKHKGYPTKYHFKMLKKYGPCVIHRKSFKPLQRFN